MSQYYELGEVTLWNPSNGASRLFLHQAALFEEEVGLPSGIGPVRNDEVQISPEAFKVFVHALLGWRGRTRHVVISALSDGFLATVLVLADRAGIVVEWPDRSSGDAPDRRDVQVGSGAVPVIDPDGWEARMRDQARELAGFMPR